MSRPTKANQSSLLRRKAYLNMPNKKKIYVLNSEISNFEFKILMLHIHSNYLFLLIS
jgi:hypothetical protein